MPSSLPSYIDFSTNSPAGGGLSALNAAFWLSLFSAQKQSNIIGDMLEIGIWHGYTAALLGAQLRNNENLGLIDICMDKEVFIPNILKFSPDCADNIKFWKSSSFDMRRQQVLLDGIGDLRFVHIDGEHSYEAIENDFLLVINKLSNNGIIVFDDIFLNNCPQLTEAVFDLRRKYRSEVSMFAVGLNKAYFCRPRSLQFYRDVTRKSPIILDAVGQHLRVCAGGWSTETTYYGLAQRDKDTPKWLAMNHLTDEISDII